MAEVDHMTYEQQFAALKALAREASLHMRKPGDWYVLMTGVESGGDGLLASVGGDGKTPQAAIEATWRQVTALPPGQYLVRDAMRSTRKHFIWNGYMWEELPHEITIG